MAEAAAEHYHGHDGTVRQGVAYYHTRAAPDDGSPPLIGHLVDGTRVGPSWYWAQLDQDAAEASSDPEIIDEDVVIVGAVEGPPPVIDTRAPSAVGARQGARSMRELMRWDRSRMTAAPVVDLTSEDSAPANVGYGLFPLVFPSGGRLAGGPGGPVGGSSVTPDPVSGSPRGAGTDGLAP